MIRLHKLSENTLAPVLPGRLTNEDMIEGWIAEQPELLGLDRLLIIGRQVTTTYGGSIDLLSLLQAQEKAMGFRPSNSP